MPLMSVTNLATVNEFRRIDSEFFSPPYLAAENAVKRCSIVPFRRLGRFLTGPFGSAFHVSGYDKLSSIRYIRGQDVKPFFIQDDANRNIPEAVFFRLSKYAVEAGDILISVVGTLGNVAIITSDAVPAIFSCKSTLFRTTAIDPFYLLTFLNCRFGQLCTLRRQRGAIQTGLNIEDLQSIPIPRFGAVEEASIGEMVRKAREALLASRDAYSKAQRLLSLELGLDVLESKDSNACAPKFSTITLSKTFTANRIDAQCFSPDALAYDTWLTRNASCMRLKTLIYSPTKGRQQVETPDGVLPYCSIKHISAREIVTDLRSRLVTGTPIARRNNLLLAITGATIGKVGVVNRYEELTFSGDLLALRVRDDVDPYYLLLALDHRMGQVQFTRWITGSTNGHLSPADVGRVLIPRLNCEKESEAAELIRVSLNNRYESERLLDSAKSRVESLIEEGV